jgi:hypothetical protein
MKRKQFLHYLGASLGAITLAPVLTACGGGGDELASTATPGTLAPSVAAAPIASTEPTAATPVAALSPEEIAGLKFMREEEKLAHDVYVALYSVWGAQVFANIAKSETEHTEAIRRLLLSHGLEDPAATTGPGVFVNTELQALYDKLVAMGKPSLNDALAVGCLIEEKDIQDINDKKAQVIGEPDIVQSYDNLLCGSRNHLRAFNGQLLARGVTYVPQVLTQAEWDAIANAASETCGG